MERLYQKHEKTSYRWEKTSANHKCDEGLASRIYRELANSRVKNKYSN